MGITLVERMTKSETACFELSSLGRALGTLATRLPEGELEIKKGASSLVERMAKSETASNELASLSDALGKLAAHLPEGDADVKKWTAALVERMVNFKTDSDDQSCFGEVLGSLAENGHLSAREAAAVGAKLWSLVQHRPEAERISLVSFRSLCSTNGQA